jgi:phage gpG-like protein
MSQDVTFRVEGLNKLLKALEQLDQEAKQNFRAAGKWAGEEVAKTARGIVPVGTGRLQKSIKGVATARGAKVRAGRSAVPYAGPIHFGWGRRNIFPQPFLYRAADRRVNDVVDQYLAQIFQIWNRNV